jgi:hypothetical protein
MGGFSFAISFSIIRPHPVCSSGYGLKFIYPVVNLWLAVVSLFR